MEMYGKNVFNKDAGVLANIFGVVAAIWIIPVVLLFFIMQLIIDGIKSLINKFKNSKKDKNKKTKTKAKAKSKA